MLPERVSARICCARSPFFWVHVCGRIWVSRTRARARSADCTIVIVFHLCESRGRGPLLIKNKFMCTPSIWASRSGGDEYELEIPTHTHTHKQTHTHTIAAPHQKRTACKLACAHQRPIKYTRNRINIVRKLYAVATANRSSLLTISAILRSCINSN